MKRIIIYLIIISLSFTPIIIKAEQTEIYLSVDRLTRASRIISSSSWYLDKSMCSFSLSFINICTGEGIVTLQKKLSDGSWNDIKSLNIGFKDSISMSSTLYNLSLYSGTHRLKYNLTVGSLTEIIYSSEKIL